MVAVCRPVRVGVVYSVAVGPGFSQVVARGQGVPLMIFQFTGAVVGYTENGLAFRLDDTRRVWVPRKVLTTQEKGDYTADVGHNWRWRITDHENRKDSSSTLGVELAEEWPQSVTIHEEEG